MIDLKKIDNAAIADAVMTLVIPAVNALEERIDALEAAARTATPAATPAAKKPATRRRRSTKKTE